MYTNVIIPRDETAWITAVSKDAGFAIVAGCADVIWPCDVVRLSSSVPFLTSLSPLYFLPRLFSLLAALSRSISGLPIFILGFPCPVVGMQSHGVVFRLPSTKPRSRVVPLGTGTVVVNSVFKNG